MGNFSWLLFVSSTVVLPIGLNIPLPTVFFIGVCPSCYIPIGLNIPIVMDYATSFYIM